MFWQRVPGMRAGVRRECSSNSTSPPQSNPRRRPCGTIIITQQICSSLQMGVLVVHQWGSGWADHPRLQCPVRCTKSNRSSFCQGKAVLHLSVVVSWYSTSFFLIASGAYIRSLYVFWCGNNEYLFVCKPNDDRIIGQMFCLHCVCVLTDLVLWWWFASHDARTWLF